MDPLSLMISAAGTAMSAFGTMQASQIAQQQANVSTNIANTEMQEDALRKQGMEMQASRQNIEVLRNAQRARATATAGAVAGGAQFGSGLQGGYAQIGGQMGFNQLGISQQKQLGEQMFADNAQIDQYKMQMAQLGGSMAKAQGLTALGGDISKMAGPGSSLMQTGLSMFSGGAKGFGGM